MTTPYVPNRVMRQRWVGLVGLVGWLLLLWVAANGFVWLLWAVISTD